jgi:hypothetical protein
LRPNQGEKMVREMNGTNCHTGLAYCANIMTRAVNLIVNLV